MPEWSSHTGNRGLASGVSWKGTESYLEAYDESLVLAVTTLGVWSVGGS